MQQLATYWDTASPLMTAMSDNFLLLQLVCVCSSPTAILTHLNAAMASDHVVPAIQSRSCPLTAFSRSDVLIYLTEGLFIDDPQTTLTNYGALVFLASTVCFKYDVSTYNSPTYKANTAENKFSCHYHPLSEQRLKFTW